MNVRRRRGSDKLKWRRHFGTIPWACKEIVTVPQSPIDRSTCRCTHTHTHAYRATPYSSGNELLMCAARISFHLCESRIGMEQLLQMMRFKFALMLWVIAF